MAAASVCWGRFSDWKYGPSYWSAPMPSQAMALMMPSIHSGRLRAASVSSMRSTSVPPAHAGAKAQLNKTDLALPTWNMPVGDGAKRARTAEPELVTAAEFSRVAARCWARGTSGRG